MVLFPVLEVKVLDKAMGEGGGGDGVGGVGGKSEGKKTSDPPKGKKKKGKGGGKGGGGSKIEKMLMNAAEHYDDGGGEGGTTKGDAASGKGAQGEVRGKGPSPKGEAQGGEGEGESAAEGEGESPEAEGEGEGLKNGKKKAGKNKAVAHRKGKFLLQHYISTCFAVNSSFRHNTWKVKERFHGGLPQGLHFAPFFPEEHRLRCRCQTTQGILSQDCHGSLGHRGPEEGGNQHPRHDRKELNVEEREDRGQEQVRRRRRRGGGGGGVRGRGGGQGKGIGKGMLSHLNLEKTFKLIFRDRAVRTTYPARARSL